MENHICQDFSQDFSLNYLEQQTYCYQSCLRLKEIVPGHVLRIQHQQQVQEICSDKIAVVAVAVGSQMQHSQLLLLQMLYQIRNIKNRVCTQIQYYLL